MVQEFRWAHGLMRREVLAARDLTRRLLAGDEQEQTMIIGDTGERLTLVSAVRERCLKLRRFIEAHFTQEERSWLGELRRRAADCGPIVARVDADRRRVGMLLHIVEARAASSLDQEHDRRRLNEAVEGLAGHVLLVLDFEERQAFPAVRAMRDRRR